MTEETELMIKIIREHLVRQDNEVKWIGSELSARGVQRELEKRYQIRLSKSQINQRYAAIKEKVKLESTHYKTKKGVMTGKQIGELGNKSVSNPAVKDILGQLSIVKPGVEFPPFAIREVYNHSKREKIDGKWYVYE